MISLEKWTILTPLQKLPNNVDDLGKIIAATIFEKLPKVQKIAQYGHTDFDHNNTPAEQEIKILTCTIVKQVWKCFQLSSVSNTCTSG